MISVQCDLELELNGDRFRLVHDPVRPNQLLLEIPSFSAGLKLATQISTPSLRSLLWSLQQPDWLDQIHLALCYQKREMINQSLQSYARLETLWRISSRWREAFTR
ncbi:hypothetical protein JST97_18895 [bacterium]|nr:hypothetical protein [bacterium]